MSVVHEVQDIEITDRDRLPAPIAELGGHYRSGTHDLGRDFFLPCLEHCTRYRRAVGFFSSSSLLTWASVLPRFMSLDDLCIQLLISPHLSDHDREALRTASEAETRRGLLQQLADRMVEEAVAFIEEPGDVQRRLRLFAWLVAHDRLQLRFAFPSHVDQPGIFHEKIGVFEFPGDHAVAFTGSANESASGHSHNYETVDVFRSWIEADGDRVAVKIDEFEQAWEGKAEGLRVLPLSAEALDRIKSIAPEGDPSHFGQTPVPTINKWRHQDEAIEAFLKAKHGLLEMATGTGKTRTALEILKRLVTSGTIESVLIAADGNDLLDQWHLRASELARDLGFSVTRRYREHNDQETYAMNPSHRIHLCSRQRLPRALSKIPADLKPRVLLIHDEVHRLGSPANRRDLDGLERGIDYRLGLSATPDREYDADGNAFIDKHIGPTIYQFGLEDAIQRGILCPFNYYPLEWEPSDDDRANIQNVYKQAAARKASGDPMTQEQLWTRIAMVYKTSETKLPAFREFLSQRPDLIHRSILFVATHDYAEHVIPYVHDLTLKFHTYFEGASKDVLHRFSREDLDCLITCHRLSEGIDIQSIRTVILLSADRARLETIQRIGRCLRVDPSDPTKRANVVDFIRLPGSETNVDSADLARRDWLTDVSNIQPEVN